MGSVCFFREGWEREIARCTEIAIGRFLRFLRFFSSTGFTQKSSIYLHLQTHIINDFKDFQQGNTKTHNLRTVSNELARVMNGQE